MYTNTHKNIYKYTHTEREREREREGEGERDTHTHIEAHYIILVFLRKCRNKTKNNDDRHKTRKREDSECKATKEHMLHTASTFNPTAGTSIPAFGNNQQLITAA